MLSGERIQPTPSGVIWRRFLFDLSPFVSEAVAPHAGARIETLRLSAKTARAVAPHAGHTRQVKR